MAQDKWKWFYRRHSNLLEFYFLFVFFFLLRCVPCWDRICLWTLKLFSISFYVLLNWRHVRHCNGKKTYFTSVYLTFVIIFFFDQWYIFDVIFHVDTIQACKSWADASEKMKNVIQLPVSSSLKLFHVFVSLCGPSRNMIEGKNMPVCKTDVCMHAGKQSIFLSCSRLTVANKSSNIFEFDEFSIRTSCELFLFIAFNYYENHLL